MDLGKFGTGARGRLVPIAGFDPRFDEHYEHAAFVPDPLPTEPMFPPTTYEAVARAESAVARLDQALGLLPNPALLNRPAIRREAQSTSALEGTFVAFDDVLEADFVDAGDLSADVREVYNAVRAAEFAFAQLPHRGITVGLLTDLQRLIVDATPSHNEDAGRIRQTQVFIGAQRRRVADARFVPPPPGDQLEADVASLIEWSKETAGPIVLRAALSHYQFETLHPFVDGNGRVGRLLVILQMIDNGLLREPVLNISPWLEERRESYQDHLLAVSCTGNFAPWVEFFSEAVEAGALEQVRKIERLLAWRAAIMKRLSEANVRGVGIQIAGDLVGYPFITPTLAAMIHGRTYQACNTAIRKLVALGILQERSGRNYNRIFVATEVQKIVAE